MPRTANKTASTKKRAAAVRHRARGGAARTAKRATTGQARRKAPISKGKSAAPASDAVAYLKADHRRIRRLLHALKAASAPGQRERALTQVKEALAAHTKLEEEIFYPAFRNAAVTQRDRQLFHEATEEHYVVDRVLPEVAAALDHADVCAARAKVLTELVEHHAEEEETEMFRRARVLLPPTELRRLGAEMNERRRTLERGGGPFSAVAALFTR
jgi:hemerythrin superfamily protein